MRRFYSPEKARVTETVEGRAMATRFETMSDEELLVLVAA